MTVCIAYGCDAATLLPPHGCLALPVYMLHFDQRLLL